MDRGLDFALLDVTHKCNLDCGFCGKMIWDSDYEITLRQVELIRAVMPKVEFVRISGGEPLVHPDIGEIIEMMAVFYPIEIGTNGLLLAEHPVVMDICNKVHVTPYPNINDHIIGKYKDYPNFNIVRINTWFQPFADPNYTKEEAQVAYDLCCHVQANYCGDRVYPCCQAETLERIMGLNPVHVKLRPGWEEEYKELDCLEACQHCFVALAEEGAWRV